MKHTSYHILFVIFCFLLYSCSKKVPRSLADHGVKVTWHYDGATSSYPWITVTSDYGNCPDIFGGIQDPKIEYQDITNDGIEEIIFGSATQKQIISLDANTKKWKVLRNDL